MPFDFPSSPTNGQTVSGPAGAVYVFDGVKWKPQASANAWAPVAAPVFTGDARAVTPTAGDNDTSLATTAFVQATTVPALNNVGRNLLHNALFNVAQRGAGPWTVNGYTLDRWSLYLNTDAVSISQQPCTIPADEAARRCLTNVFTGSAGATAQHIIYQPIEDVSRLGGKTVTVSFYAVATAGTPKLAVSIDQLFGTGGSPSARVNGPGQATSALTSGWVRYSLTFNVPSIGGKTLGTNGDSATWLVIWYSNGVAADATRSAGIGVQSGTVGLWGVQLEIGSIATPLEKPDPQQDLAKCQRFYQVVSASVRSTAAGASANYDSTVNFAVMRATPTVTLSAPGSSANATAITLLAATQSGGRFEAMSVAAGDVYAINYAYALSADL